VLPCSRSAFRIVASSPVTPIALRARDEIVVAADRLRPLRELQRARVRAERVLRSLGRRRGRFGLLRLLRAAGAHGDEDADDRDCADAEADVGLGVVRWLDAFARRRLAEEDAVALGALDLLLEHVLGDEVFGGALRAAHRDPAGLRRGTAGTGSLAAGRGSGT
jgi:hypothetical protein